MRSKKRIVLLSLFILCMILLSLGTFLFIQRIYDSWEYKAKRNAENSVFIYADRYSGSGVILEMDNEWIYIVSNKHVLAEVAQAEVTFLSNEKAYGTVMGYSMQEDLSFLKVACTDLSKETLLSIRTAECADRDEYNQLKKGDLLFLVGSANGVASNRYVGTVENTNCFVAEFNSFMLIGQCESKEGMSGCGIYNERGRMIAILAGRNDTNSAGIPIETVLNEYEEVNK